LSIVPPHVFIPLAKLGLSLVSGFRLEAEEVSKSLQEEIDEWVRGQPKKQVPELHPTVIKFRNDRKTAYLRLVNQLLRFLPTSEHDNAPDVLGGCSAADMVIGKGGNQAID